MHIDTIEKDYVILRDKYLHWVCIYIDNNDNKYAKMQSDKYKELAHNARRLIHKYSDF